MLLYPLICAVDSTWVTVVVRFEWKVQLDLFCVHIVETFEAVLSERFLDYCRDTLAQSL